MEPEDTAPDEVVLRRARDGDAEAHAALYRAYAPMVYTLALRMLGSRAAAEDALQDSFVEVIRKAGSFRGDCAIESWIRRIAINKCLSNLRSPWIARRAPVAGTDPGGGGDRDGSMSAHARRSDEEQAQSLDRSRLVERAFAMLSPVARSVVWLHDVEGYTHREIGEFMGRSTSFSKTQLARAHALLRERLDPETAAGPARSTEEAPSCLAILKSV